MLACVLVAACTSETCSRQSSRRSGNDTVEVASANDASLRVPDVPPDAPDASRRHVVLIIGDGMQLEHEIAASRYLYGTDDGMSWRHFPYQGYCSTWDIATYNAYAVAAGASRYDSGDFDPRFGYDPARGGAEPYPLAAPPNLYDYLAPNRVWPATDSAAAATAMSTGHKTDAGNIAWQAGDPDQGALTTIAQTLRDKRGFAIGVVSTVPFTHATPAAFVSHNVDRNNYHAIGDEIVDEIRPDVVVGGGHPRWTRRFVSAQAYATLKRSTNYVFVERTPAVDGGKALREGAEAAVAKKRKLFGLFGGSEGNFEYRPVADDPGAPAVGIGNQENPKLAQVTEAALRVLSTDPDGFFLMIEQGDIDWANHANNYANMIGCMADLEEAVRAVVAFVERPGDVIDWSNTLVLVTSDHANSYMRLDPAVKLGAGDLPACQGVTGAVSCKSDDGRVAVTYGSSGHTNELVTLSAMGVGADTIAETYAGRWYPGTKIVDNTAIYSIMMRAAGM